MEFPIEDCPRCLGFHLPHIKFSSFSIGQVGKYTHWAMCPSIGEPILIEVSERPTLIGVG